MMRRDFAAIAGVFAVGTLLAAPEASVISVSQDAATHAVTVNYSATDSELEGENPMVIVTADVKTNGVSLAGHLDYLRGEVNKKVSLGLHSFYWYPQKDGFTGSLENVSVELTVWNVSAPPDYLVIDLESSSNAWYYAKKEMVPFGITNMLYRTGHLLMRKIPARSVRWKQGKASPGLGEQLQRWCTLGHDYYIGVYEFTRGQYKYFKASSDYNSYTDNLDCPITYIGYETLRGATASYNWPANGHSVGAASAFGKMRSLTGFAFDLPTGAEWEFACRAGTGAATYGDLADIAWYGTCPVSSYPVGLKQPNAWGIYDMIGNVFEYCLDWLSRSTESDDAEVTDPNGPTEYEDLGGDRGNGGRMWRGGSIGYGTTYANATYPYTWGKVGTAACLGFRVCCPIEEE